MRTPYGFITTLLFLMTPNFSYAFGLKEFVESLYKQYAWVSVLSPAAASKFVVLQDEKLPTLNKYFSKALSSAIHEDARCRWVTREICKIDFDILFASQDVVATDLTVSDEVSGVVSVCFRTVDAKKCLRIEASQDVDGWRIADIIYPLEDHSLTKVLGLKSHAVVGGSRGTIPAQANHAQLNESNEPLPANFSNSAVADTFETNTIFSAENVYKTVQIKSTCTALSDAELEKYRKQFYFGKGLGNESPTCLVRRLEVVLNGMRQYIPNSVVQMFADGPIFSTINSAGTNKIFMLVFKGGAGTGSYEARLSFRNNRLVKRQVWGLEPKQSKFKYMVSEFK